MKELTKTIGDEMMTQEIVDLEIDLAINHVIKMINTASGVLLDIAIKREEEITIYGEQDRRLSDCWFRLLDTTSELKKAMKHEYKNELTEPNHRSMK